MKNARRVFVLALAISMVLGQASIGELSSPTAKDVITSVPRSMTYQGVLKDSNGEAVTDSVYNVTFRIFNVTSGGMSLWNESLPCTTSAGVFFTAFNDVNLPFDEDYWLELEVGGEILNPRQKMSMVGYAARADTADYAFATSAGGNGWIDDGTVVRLETATDSVGIGTTTPSEMLEVNGNILVNGKATLGSGNINTGIGSFVAGENNSVSGNWATISGGGGFSGMGNSASADHCTIAGGLLNTANGMGATVSGGGNNTAFAYAAVGGGTDNVANGQYSAISGGTHNSTPGNYSMVPGGSSNSAANAYALAAGRRAKAVHDGAFVWADHSDADFASSATDQFNVRASGGTRIYSDAGLMAGVELTPGASSWSSITALNAFKNVREIDGKDILNRIQQLPIKVYNLESEAESVEHIGPMAADFNALFMTGNDDEHISALDQSGVALAGVQALLARIEELEKEVAELKANQK